MNEHPAGNRRVFFLRKADDVGRRSPGARMERKCDPGPLARCLAPSRITLALHPGYGTAPVSLLCQSLAAKIFHFTEIRFCVCVAHPGSSLRGDLVVVTFASRACGGRGSVRVRVAKGRADCSP